MPSGSRQAIMPSAGHADQRIGAFDHAQRIDEPVQQRRIAAVATRWMMTSVSEVDWKIEPRRIQLAPQLHRVGDVAVVRDREAAEARSAKSGCTLRSARFAGGRIAHMAAGDVAGQGANRLVIVEIARDMAHRALGVEITSVPAGDSRCFLPAMLERMEPERDHRGGRFRAGNAEDAALLAQLVVIERVRGQHGRGVHCKCVFLGCGRLLARI
jgi:hypothetical protein